MKEQDLARVEATADPHDAPTAESNTLPPASVSLITRLPWQRCPHQWDRVEGAEGCDEPVALVQRADDARYIIRAANCFPDLLAALKGLERDCDDTLLAHVGTGYMVPETLERARAAIAKAEAKHV